MSQTQDELAEHAMVTLDETYKEAASRPEITHNERVNLMSVYARGTASIIRALRGPELRRARPPVDQDESAVLAAETPWLLLEAHNILIEVDSDRAKAWLERFKGAMLPMIRRYAGDEETK